jgi:hypothetical protein
MALERAFPGRGLSFHLLGSYADGSPAPTSDLDLIVLFPGILDSEEAVLANSVVSGLSAQPGPRLDVELQGEASVNPIWAVSLAQASVGIFGEPETEVSMPSMEAYAWALIEEVCSLTRRLRPRLASVSFPVDYPDREAPVFGYEQKPLLTADGTWVPSSKALAMVTGWGASAILAVRAGVFTPSRSMLIASYRQHVGDRWLQLLEQIEAECHIACNYLIPADGEGRRRLREIAARVLEFENHTLAIFEPAIHVRLTSAYDSKRSAAMAVLDSITFPNSAVGQQ